MFHFYFTFLPTLDTYMLQLMKALIYHYYEFLLIDSGRTFTWLYSYYHQRHVLLNFNYAMEYFKRKIQVYE